MPWQPLERFRDPSVPKLDNLRRAHAAGLRVPPTRWAPARELAGLAVTPPDEIGAGPWIVRSGSPTEEQRTTSNAGQLLSLVVREAVEFPAAAARVVVALPRDPSGAALGAVFVQPLVNALEAGVVFFDGFYYERTTAAGGNQDVTAGHARGEVCRGHRMRADTWSDWLASVHDVFGAPAGGDHRLDIEFARDGDGLVLLQVRPALFPVHRNETLTLANHKETLGDLPSPWIVSALVQAGRELSFLSAVDPAVRAWDEPYAIALAERAWLNLCLWFRVTDHFGLPRTLATRGVGGHLGAPADERPIPHRLLRALPRLLPGQWLGWKQVRDIGRGLRRLDAQIEEATDLAGLHRATVAGLRLAVDTNFAIAGLCTGLAVLRKLLRVPGSARPVTQEMMEAYGRLTELPDPAEREAGLDRWLARYGHRGPLESDLARPRFAELRSVLLGDLRAAPPPAAGARPEQAHASRRPLEWLFRPLFAMDARREWFRDAMMRRWQRLRMRILEAGARLEAAGDLDHAEDVFSLRGADLDGTGALRQAAAAGRQRAESVRGLDLPLTAASRDEIEALVTPDRVVEAVRAGRRVFPGIPLGPAVCEGEAVKADDLTALLAGLGSGEARLGPDRILVVPSLEPSWAVVFPRVGGVVAELGGELSHASILLREAGRPAIVNCADVFRLVHNGDRLRLDGRRGVVEVVSGEW